MKNIKISSVECRVRNNYTVFDIREDLGIGSDFGDLTNRIRKCVDSGGRKIALRFTSNSYLYTSTLARLVNFYKIISESKGTLCIIGPNEGIREVLELIGLTGVVMIVATEEELDAV
jgi:anti-anti-sigma factor